MGIWFFLFWHVYSLGDVFWTKLCVKLHFSSLQLFAWRLYKNCGSLKSQLILLRSYKTYSRPRQFELLLQVWLQTNFFVTLASVKLLSLMQVSLMHSISSCSFMGVNSVSWVIGWWMDWSLKVGLDVWKYGFKNMWKRNFRFHLFQSKS